MSDPRDVLGPTMEEAVRAIAREEYEALRAHAAGGSTPEWLSIKDAAAYVSVSPRALMRRLDWGQIESSYFGRRRLVSRRSLLAYVEEAATRRGEC